MAVGGAALQVLSKIMLNEIIKKDILEYGIGEIFIACAEIVQDLLIPHVLVSFYGIEKAHSTLIEFFRRYKIQVVTENDNRVLVSIV